MRQSRDKIDVDVGDSRGAQMSDILLYRLPLVQTPDGCGLEIDKGLHTQAHAIHAASLKIFNHGRRKRTGSALHGNFRSRLDLEILRNCDTQLTELGTIQYSGSSAAQVYGVDGRVEACAHAFSGLGSALDVRANAIDVALKNGTGEDVRS